MKLIGILAIVIFLSAVLLSVVLFARRFRGSEDFSMAVKPLVSSSLEIPSILPQSDEIKIIRPQAGEKITSPVEISGQARGQWFFEASFPVKLLDAGGKVAAQGTARAESDWMTTDWVDFTAQLEFVRPTTETGTLILQNYNPSGLAQNAKQYSLPVKFNLFAN